MSRILGLVLAGALDVQAYLALVARNVRWTDLAGNTAYPAGKSVLVTSTDYRTSNSAAMYLSIASYVANGGNVVADGVTARHVTPLVAPLFLRQGFAASSSEEPFQDYLSIGIGKIVLMTDGENNVGRDGPRFLADYRQLPDNVRAVKTFAVLFGEASPAELRRMADTTGGTVFDGRTASLSQVFKDISGYQ